MMKGFVKKGLVLLALGVLFAGCASPSSQEGSASSRDTSGNVGIPMTMDPANHKLTIGDGSGGYVGVFYDSLGSGHTVEIINGSTTTSNGNLCVADGNGSKCWIRVHNRDSDEYMANTFVAFTICATCDVGLGGNYQMDNFDASWPGGVVDDSIFKFDMPASSPIPGNGTIVVLDAYTVHPQADFTGSPATMGAPTPVPGYGVAYVTDTANPELVADSKNPYGAPLRDLPTTTNAKAEWMIAPQCGYGSQEWDFGGNSSVLFSFFATVKATWFPINPFGGTDNGVRGGTPDDPRFDFQNFGTVFLTVTDLVSATTDSTYRKIYRPGTVYRSNVLAGYKPAWARGASGKSVADITFATQKYFAVNVGVEASDRLESMSFGLKSDPYHEYYKNISILVTYDATIVKEMSLPSSTNWYPTKLVAGTRFQHKANSMCVNQLNCQNWSNDQALDMQIDIDATSVTAGDRAGYISVTANNLIDNTNNFWSYFTQSEAYTAYDMVTETSLPRGVIDYSVDLSQYRQIPKNFFFRGFAKLTCMTTNADCVAQDTPDEEPEMWLYNFILKVQPGTVGLGSEIKVETFSSYTSFEMMWTNSGFHQGDGSVASCPDPDPGSGCTDAGPTSADDKVPFTVSDGSTLVIGSAPLQEVSNTHIRHRGPAIVAGNRGTFQAWNVGVCIK